MATSASNRGAWGSRTAFILAAAGSAIGLGNIWGFPTQTGLNGGAGFVLVYLICVLLIGVPVMIAELVIGRAAGSDPVGAFKKLMPGTAWKAVGGLGVAVGLVILSYYSVLAGWTLNYIRLTATGAFANTDSAQVAEVFGAAAGNGVLAITLHGLFMVLTVWVVTGGIKGGIERVTSLLMPVLLVLLVLLALRSITLPGAGAGLDFYLRPDFSKITGSVIVSALGQAFFSLSLGMGAMITYGSYLSKRENLVSSAFYVCMADVTIAVLAGIVIFPALFSVPGLEPNQGPGLIFVVLPNIFNAIPLGQLFGTAFYVLLAIAALTSSISLLEVVVAYFIDQRGMERRQAAMMLGGAAFLLGIPSALGNGAVGWLTDMSLPGFETLGTGFVTVADFVVGKLLLIVGAFFICVFLAWKWGLENALAEISEGCDSFSLQPVWTVLIKWVCPVAIVIILIGTIQSNM